MAINLERYLERIKKIWKLKGGKNMGAMKKQGLKHIYTGERRVWVNGKLLTGKVRADEHGEAEIITTEGMDSFGKDQFIANSQDKL